MCLDFKILDKKSNFPPAFIQHHPLTYKLTHTHTWKLVPNVRVNFSFTRSMELFLQSMINLEVLACEFNNIFDN